MTLSINYFISAHQLSVYKLYYNSLTDQHNGGVAQHSSVIDSLSMPIIKITCRRQSFINFIITYKTLIRKMLTIIMSTTHRFFCANRNTHKRPIILRFLNCAFYRNWHMIPTWTLLCVWCLSAIDSFFCKWQIIFVYYIVSYGDNPWVFIYLLYE